MDALQLVVLVTLEFIYSRIPIAYSLDFDEETEVVDIGTAVTVE